MFDLKKKKDDADSCGQYGENIISCRYYHDLLKFFEQGK